METHGYIAVAVGVQRATAAPLFLGTTAKLAGIRQVALVDLPCPDNRKGTAPDKKDACRETYSLGKAHIAELRLIDCVTGVR